MFPPTSKTRDAPPHARVLDVGGNIGYFSFFSAAHVTKSLHVDTFEPNPVNLLRACETRALNQWKAEDLGRQTPPIAAAPTVNLWQWGISDNIGSFHFEHNANPGAGKFTTNVRGASTNATKLNVTTLDAFAAARGWLDVDSSSTTPPPRIEILKIDVESHETCVLTGAKALLQRRIIRNIFMEWTVNRNKESFRNKQGKAMQILLDAGYTLCAWGGFLGPSPDKKLSFDATNHETFLDDFFEHHQRRKAGAINVWWQSDPTCPMGGPEPYQEKP